MSKLLLKLAMLFSALWRSLGADVDQLRIILETKLTIDNRKPVAFGANRGAQKKRKKERKNTIVFTMLLSLLTGFIYVFPILVTLENVILGLSLFYTMFLFFSTFTLLTDFSNVLVDTKDKYILFSRPINDKTLTLSRLIYIGIYLFRMVIPMSIPPWIIFGIFQGWVAAVWFPFSIFFCVLIVLFIVCGLYLLMIRIAGAAKFKDVLNYFQIGFSIVFFVVYMFASRTINPKQFEGVSIEAYDWARYVPSYWIAASYSWVDSSVDLIPGTKWFSVLAILFPLFSLWATIKWLAPSFSSSLLAGENAAAKKKTQHKKKTVSGRKLYLRLASRLNNNDTAKAGFIITWLQTARNRNFMMRVYPAMAYVPVYFFYLLLSSDQSFAEVWKALPEKNVYVVLLYLTTFAIMQSLTYVTMSDQYKAAWVYYSSPVDKPGQILTGAVKAMWVKFFLPFMVAIGIFVVYVWGLPAILDVVLATINITLFIVLMMRFNYRILPFSVKEQIKDSGVKTAIRIIVVMTIIGVLGVGHYFATLWWWLKLIFAGLSSVLLWLLYDSLQNLPWEKIKNTED